MKKVCKNIPQKKVEFLLFSKKVYCGYCSKTFYKNNAKTKVDNKEYYLQNFYSNICNDIKRIEKQKMCLILQLKKFFGSLYVDKVICLLE